MTKLDVHVADFVRTTEHGSEFFRVKCRETGHTAKFWPSYLRDGDKLVVMDEPGDEVSCFRKFDHANAKGKP